MLRWAAHCSCCGSGHAIPSHGVRAGFVKNPAGWIRACPLPPTQHHALQGERTPLARRACPPRRWKRPREEGGWLHCQLLRMQKLHLEQVWRYGLQKLYLNIK